MRDWISDWKRWSRAERCFVIMLVIIALALPLGLLIAGERMGANSGPATAASSIRGKRSLLRNEASQ